MSFFLWLLYQEVFFVVANGSQEQRNDNSQCAQSNTNNGKAAEQSIQRQYRMDRGEQAKEAQVFHNITHHTYNVGDENHSQRYGNAFSTAAEQCRDQKTKGDVNKTNEELADEYADHIDHYTGNAHVTIKEPNDSAGYSKKNQAVNNVAKERCNGFLNENAASCDRQTIEEFNGAAAFFHSEGTSPHGTSINTGEEKHKLEKVCSEIIRMAQVGHAVKTENAADDTGHCRYAISKGFGIEHPGRHIVKEHQHNDDDGHYDAPTNHTSKTTFEIEFKNGHAFSPPS